MSSSDTKTQIKCLGIYILIFYSNINTICQVKQPFFKLQELPLWTPETTNAYTFALLVKDKPKTRQCTSWIVSLSAFNHSHTGGYMSFQWTNNKANTSQGTWVCS